MICRASLKAMDDWDWDQFLSGALNSGSLGFLYSPERALKTSQSRALRMALAQRIGAKMDGRSDAIAPVRQRSFVDGAVNGLTMGWAPRRR